jgi:glycosyltransferase involved in cell wall biosynthesis
VTSASVVIPNHNYERFLRDAVDSALRQTVRPQVIVVDDGSTDGSREVLRSYGDAIDAICKERGGQTAALNAALERAGGDVVLILDADDRLKPTAVERVLSTFSDPAVAKVHWALDQIDEDGTLTGHREPTAPLPAGDLREIAARDGPDGHRYPPCSGNAWRRGFLEEVFPLPEFERQTGRGIAAVDALLCTLAPLYGTVARIDEPQSEMRWHSGSNYGGRPFDARLEHNLYLHVRRCDMLAEHCRRLGLEFDRARWDALCWVYQLAALARAVVSVVDEGERFVLIDDDQCAMEATAGRVAVPLIARDGLSWGPPADDAEALAALEGHVADGVRWLAHAWTAAWWRDCYPGLFARLGAPVRAGEQVSLYRLS